MYHQYCVSYSGFLNKSRTKSSYKWYLVYNTINQYRCTRNCHLIKYADDTVIVGLISNNDESEYNEQISEVVLWCKAHNLLLNAAKTKELIFDFRHCNISHVPLSIDKSIVEICDNFKYLGITFDCKLKWANHCTLIVSMCKRRLFFLRQLNSFGVKNDILHVFYTSMIESFICYNISLWWSSMNENDKKALNRITKQAANVTQSELSYIDDLYCNIVTKKVKCIMANSCHALHDYYAYMRTGTRLPALSCRTQRYRKYFVPNSIHVTNNRYQHVLMM